MHLAKGSLFKGAALLLSAQALACSRVTYHANIDQRITVGRSMDFVASTNSSIYVFPAGMQRNGSTKENPITWTAKYGSMITTMYDHVSTDGMNSAGLTGSLLFLGVSDYGQRNNSSPGLAIGFWLQYFLDQFATVAEVADTIQHTDMQVVPADFVPGVTSTGHISLSDKLGDNLILEYLNGQLVMHHGQQYSVMTNDPAFDDQIALNTYWTPIANVSLPGTQSPADRFVRLSYYNRMSPESPDLISSIATTAAMIRAVSVPFVPPDQINTGVDVWPTLWRVYQDTHDMVFFYESSVVPMSFYMDFADFNMTSGAKVLRLGLTDADWGDRYGDMNGKFAEADAFIPLGAGN